MTLYLVHNATKLQKKTTKRIIECNKCNSRSFLTIDTNGLKQKVCAFCFMRGEFVTR